MTRRIEAFILLRTGWRPEIAAFAKAIEDRFPEIGPVAGHAAAAESGTPDRLEVDGASVALSVVNAPYPPEQLLAPVRLIDHVDPDALVATQLAYVMLSAEAPEGEAEIVEAYAALVTLVAATVTAEAPALAAFWSESWRLLAPPEMARAAERVMEGDPPRDVWISFAELRGQRAGGGANRGLMSFGLRAFCGREVEVAPAPMTLAEAEAMARTVVARMLDGPAIADGESLEHEGRVAPATLRLADRYLRPRQPAVVVVVPDAVVAADTLEPKEQAKRGGFVGRLFGR